jgi:hypothetical protein
VYFRGSRTASLVIDLEDCERVWDETMAARNRRWAQAFYEPIDVVALNIPTYYTVIEKPMDLGTIGVKLKEGQYQNPTEFEADIRLIVENCYKFNGAEHPVSMWAKQSENKFDREWQLKKKLIFDNGKRLDSLENSEFKQKLASLPDLFYEGVDWSIQDQAKWLKTPHPRRRYLLDARSRPRSDLSALPIALAQSKSPTGPLTISADTTASALLYINPHPQIGFKSELLGIKYQLKRLCRIPSTNISWNTLCSFAGMESTLKMEVDGLEGLAKRLEEMWKEGEKWARVSVEDIMKAEHIILHDYEKDSIEEVRPRKKLRLREDPEGR